MEWIAYFFDLFLHLDKHLGEVIKDYGAWTYLILLVIIFCETGLVVTPFLPGDSLLFAAGTFAALGVLDPIWLFVLLSLAAIAGDTVNYWMGAYIGPRAFSGNIRFLKKKHLDRTHAFYEKYGGKTIIIARYVPIVRTFAPFVAGVGAMNYTRFIVYNVVGGIAWVVRRRMELAASAAETAYAAETADADESEAGPPAPPAEGKDGDDE